MNKSEISAEIIEVSRLDGVVVPTMRLRMPRIILAEFNTHRVFSRNTQSTRAKSLKALTQEDLTFVPDIWRLENGKMVPDYQAVGFLRVLVTNFVWKVATYTNIGFSFILNRILGVHKELANRWVEPSMYINTILTSVNWLNFFNLRIDSEAQREIYLLASKIQHEILTASVLNCSYHLPFLSEEDKDNFEQELEKENPDISYFIKKSVAHCAMVSFKYSTEERATEVYERIWNKLLNGRRFHASPFEHQVFSLEFYNKYKNKLKWPNRAPVKSGNLNHPKLIQLRKILEITGDIYSNETFKKKKKLR